MKPNIPSCSTLRRCVPLVNDALLTQLQAKVLNRKIWVSLDETTDKQKRSIANFVFGILDDENERNKCYLANLAVMEKGDAPAVAAFFTDSLRLLYPNGKFALPTFYFLSF